MNNIEKPSLFGIKHSNRDFTDEKAWGKNSFPNAFPASLGAYLFSKNLESVYIKLNENFETYHDAISITELYGLPPTSENLFYSFETPFLQYQKFLIGNLVGIDLVTQNFTDGVTLKCIEIKLTVLPDNSTYSLTEENYGSEIVIRPSTILYLACSLFSIYENKRDNLQRIIGDKFNDIDDFTDTGIAKSYLTNIFRIINEISFDSIGLQSPLIMQPIWKTKGKTPQLAENCLDIFVWSNLAFIRLFLRAVKTEVKDLKITRPVRTLIWLFKMLYKFSCEGQVNYRKIFDELSLETKNDKAFAPNGKITNVFMKGDVLRNPRITKDEIKNIILGGGHKLLSPERRFDAIIFNSPDLF